MKKRYFAFVIIMVFCLIGAVIILINSSTNKPVKIHDIIQENGINDEFTSVYIKVDGGIKTFISNQDILNELYQSVNKVDFKETNKDKSSIKPETSFTIRFAAADNDAIEINASDHGIYTLAIKNDNSESILLNYEVNQDIYKFIQNVEDKYFKAMTSDDVTLLQEKGNALTLKDFELFLNKDGKYYLDDDSVLTVKAAFDLSIAYNPDTKPDHVYWLKNSGKEMVDFIQTP